MHCSNRSEQGLFNTSPSLVLDTCCFPQLIRMQGFSVCVFVCTCMCAYESQRVHHTPCCTLFHPSLYMTQRLLFCLCLCTPPCRNKHNLIRCKRTRARTLTCIHAYMHWNIQAVYIMNTESLSRTTSSSLGSEGEVWQQPLQTFLAPRYQRSQSIIKYSQHRKANGQSKSLFVLHWRVLTGSVQKHTHRHIVISLGISPVQEISTSASIS